MEKTYHLGLIPLDLSFCDKSAYILQMTLLRSRYLNFSSSCKPYLRNISIRMNCEISGKQWNCKTYDLGWPAMNSNNLLIFCNKTWLIIKFYRKCKIVPRESMWKNSCIDVTPDITIFRPLQMYWFLIHFKHHF